MYDSPPSNFQKHFLLFIIFQLLKLNLKRSKGSIYQWDICFEKKISSHFLVDILLFDLCGVYCAEFRSIFFLRTWGGEWGYSTISEASVFKWIDKTYHKINQIKMLSHSSLLSYSPLFSSKIKIRFIWLVFLSLIDILIGFTIIKLFK